MSAKPAKITKIVGNREMYCPERPTRINYGEVTNQPQTTIGEARLEDVFIPYYDRPGYLTDNAARTSNGKMFKIPLNRADGTGLIEERDLGA